MNKLIHTPLLSTHRKLRAKLTPFCGWEMPLSYGSIVEEHQAVRNRAGLFDISHMGRLNIEGADRLAFMKKMLPTDLNNAAPGNMFYSFLCNEQGKVLDDLTLLVREEQLCLVVNAANREKVLGWLNQWKTDYNITLTDKTLDTGMIALQGPSAIAMSNRFVQPDLEQLGYYQFTKTPFGGVDALISRSGYTGEDGIEIILPAASLVDAWNTLLEQGARPAGLGARDTLRLEAGFPLYGCELTEELTPLEARLGFAVNSPDDYIGCKSLMHLQEIGIEQRLIVFKLDGRQIPRQGCDILNAGEKVGRVTSGTFSPTLQLPIGMGYVNTPYSKVGTDGLAVKIRNQESPLQIAKIPLVPKRVAKRK